MTAPCRVTSPKHVADLKGSGLTDDTIAEAGLYSEPNAERLGKLLNWNGPARALGSGLVIPYLNLAGEPTGYVRVKVNEPRIGEEGKPVKYEAPKKHPPQAYFPPFIRRVWQSADYVLLTEGEKKSLAACQAGFPCIGLSGIWSWRRKGERDLLPELRAIPLKGRRVYICFDSDRETNQNVRKAEVGLAAVLAKYGADVRIVALPPGPDGVKVGIDDYFVNGGTVEGFRALLEAAKPAEPLPGDGYEQTDIGNGQRLADAAGRDLRFAPDRNCWLAWDAKRWVEGGAEVRVEAIAKDMLAAWAKAAAARVAKAVKAVGEAEKDSDEETAAKKVEADARRDLSFAKRSQDWRAVKRMIAAARSEPALLVPCYRDTFDRHPWLLNCPNGTVDLRTGELRPHAREDYLTRLCPVPYDPTAKAPLYFKFLADIFANRAALVEYIRRLSGVAASGDVTTRTLHFFYGTGSNGKSVLIELWMEVLGLDEYALKLPDGVLVTEANHGQHPTELADLAGIRFAVANETEQSGKLAESRVKALTGGDTLTARKMRQDFFRFNPTHKLVIASNHKPRVRGTDAGIWSRLRLVPFDVSFWKDDDQAANPGRQFDPALKADPGLKVKLLAEAPGVLADMVYMAGEFYRSGLKLTAPKDVLAATREYRQAEDVLGEFFAERVVPDTDTTKEAKDRCRVAGADLCQAYRRWADDRGEKALGTRTFGEYAKGRLESMKSRGVVYYFASLRTGPAEPGDDPDGEGGDSEGHFSDWRLKETTPKGAYREIDPQSPHPPPDTPTVNLNGYDSGFLDALR